MYRLNILTMMKKKNSCTLSYFKHFCCWSFRKDFPHDKAIPHRDGYNQYDGDFLLGIFIKEIT